ncbi:MAG TPA: hypothetical protein VGK32_17535 [Vicinamibacterales bacterium]|jgi:hypothetical protein
MASYRLLSDAQIADVHDNVDVLHQRASEVDARHQPEEWSGEASQPVAALVARHRPDVQLPPDGEWRRGTPGAGIALDHPDLACPSGKGAAHVS